MKKECMFWLLAGVLLQDTVNFDNDLLCSNANITDDLALYHLKTNPSCKQHFQQLPENVDELIEAYVIPGTEQIEKVDSPEQIEAEEVIVSEIAAKLESGITKTEIKEGYKAIGKVGEKNLTQRFLV